MLFLAKSEWFLTNEASITLNQPNSRIDVLVKGAEKSSIEVVGANSQKGKWLLAGENQGESLTFPHGIFRKSYGIKLTPKFSGGKDAYLEIRFMGAWAKRNNEILRSYSQFERAYINNRPLFDKKLVWHNEPFVVKFSKIKSGEVLNLAFEVKQPLNGRDVLWGKVAVAFAALFVVVFLFRARLWQIYLKIIATKIPFKTHKTAFKWAFLYIFLLSLTACFSKFNFFFSAILAVVLLLFVYTLRNFLKSKFSFSEPLQTYEFDKKDRQVLGFSALFLVAFGAFVFWLCFPGWFHNPDITALMTLDKAGWHPVFVSYLLEYLYFLFGKEVFYLFLINITTFCFGLWCFVAGFWLRFRSYYAFLPLLLLFVGNFFFGMIITLTYNTLYALCFGFYGLIFLYVLNKEKLAKFKFGIFCTIFTLMFCAILWRHNAIFSVFPAFFILIFSVTKRLNRRYFAWLLASAAVCLFVVVVAPKILVVNKAYPAAHTFLHQIAGACVPANDESCFKKEWYKGGKNFSDVKEVYENFLLFADVMVGRKVQIFNGAIASQNGLLTAWLKAIVKHPINYLKYELTMIKNNFIAYAPTSSFPALTLSVNSLTSKVSNHYEQFKKMNFAPKQAELNSFQKTLYSFFYNHKLEISILFGNCLAVFLMLLSTFLMFRYKKSLCGRDERLTKKAKSALSFAFSGSFAAFWSLFFISAFGPTTYPRYLSPILPLDMVALFGLIAFGAQSGFFSRLNLTVQKVAIILLLLFVAFKPEILLHSSAKDRLYKHRAEAIINSPELIIKNPYDNGLYFQLHWGEERNTYTFTEIRKNKALRPEPSLFSKRYNIIFTALESGEVKFDFKDLGNYRAIKINGKDVREEIVKNNKKFNISINKGEDLNLEFRIRKEIFLKDISPLRVVLFLVLLLGVGFSSKIKRKETK